MGVLQQALSVALGFAPMATAQQEKLLARTEQPAAEGKYERFKTSGDFDGTAKNPKWLEGAKI
jgi:hypothetical protein